MDAPMLSRRSFVLPPYVVLRYGLAARFFAGGGDEAPPAWTYRRTSTLKEEPYGPR